MSMNSLARDLHMVGNAIHSMFVYVACTADGYVKVGISGNPAERIYQIHSCSPSPVEAAQWCWIGSLQQAKRIEKEIKREWASRNTRGEWYLFDYSEQSDKTEFHSTLAAVIEVVTGKVPEWSKLRASGLEELVESHQAAAKQKRLSGKKNHPWHATANRARKPLASDVTKK